VSAFVVTGRALASRTPQETVLETVALLVGDDGIIQRRATCGTQAYQDLQSSETVVELPDNTLLVPGLTDLHIHAPQWPQAGTALDRPLEEWLGTYTFPLEARYSDTTFAAAVYEDLVQTLLRNGTTTALYFATIDKCDFPDDAARPAD